MFYLALVLIFALLGVISYYMSVRMHKGLLAFFPKCKFRPVLAFFMTLTFLFILGFARVGFSIGAYCMGIYIYLLFYTVISHLVTSILHLTKFPFVRHPRYAGFAMMSVVLCTIVTCIWGFINVQRVHHVSYDIQIQSQTDISGLNIVIFSDLHLGSVGSEDRLDKIVDEINHLEPDILCIAGDFFDTEFSSIQNPEKAIQTLRKIRTTYGVYACLGNHDAGKTYGQMASFLEQSNICLLNDTSVIIDNRLVLVGRLDGSPIGGYGTLKRKDFTQILTPEMKNLPVVVLDHNPANIHEYGEEADLILCGHTHKGQLFPANIITNLMYTVDYGYYQKDAQSPQVIVSSGVGYWGMPMRVGTQCEIVSIKIQ